MSINKWYNDTDSLDIAYTLYTKGTCMSRVWVAIKRFGRLIKFLLVCVILTVCVFMVWRIFSTGTPKNIDTMIPTDELCEAYSEKGKDLYVFEQKYDDITRADHNSGYFAVPQAVFIPEVNQAQIVFRYNNSTVRALATDYGIDPVPDRNEDLYNVSLVFYIDLTPEDESDNDDVNSEGLKKVRVLPSKQKSERTTLYSFYRYSFDFDNAEEEINMQQLIDDGTLVAVHAEFYYKGDLDYDKTPYGALSLYYHKRSNYGVKLTAADKKALTQ